MNISFNGFNEETFTFETDSNLETAGVPVTITHEGKVAPCAEGDLICGVAVNVREGYAAVQLKGCVSLPSKGVIGYGFRTVVATADGRVQESEHGRSVLVIASDGNSVNFIL